MPKLSDGESAFFRHAKRHLATSLKALFIPFALTWIVLASGAFLEKVADASPNSILFHLWPFNRVYLQQFANSPYDSSSIKWFFTVVSCSNAIWLVFLLWKFAFEFFRTDLKFPTGETPTIKKIVVRTPLACCVILILYIPLAMAGFSTQGNSLFLISFQQSIAAGAIKVVLIQMFALYIGAAFFLEFSGLGVRYLLSKKFGLFLAETGRSPKAES